MLIKTMRLYDAASNLECEVISLPIEPEQVYLLIDCPPDIAPPKSCTELKMLLLNT